MLIRILTIQLRRLYRGLFKREKQYIHIASKKYHITPQYKHLYPNYEDEHELTLKLTPINTTFKTSEVPMEIMVLKKKIHAINIEIE